MVPQGSVGVVREDVGVLEEGAGVARGWSCERSVNREVPARVP